MADLTITAANQRAKSNTVLKRVQFGEVVTPSEPVYLKAADSKYWLADADDSAEADAKGISYGYGDADGYGYIATGGGLDVGATLTVGETYCVSTTAGGIAPIGDLTTGDYVTILGTASAAGTLDISLKTTGVVKP